MSDQRHDKPESGSLEMNEQLLNDLEILAELFARGGWQELRVSAGGVSILLSHDKGASLDQSGAGGFERSAASSAPVPVVGQQADSTGASPAAANSVRANAPTEQGAVDANWHAVVAPNLGTFYRSPKPGSPPFVEQGQKVTANTEVCLLEVMKLFTSVNAGVSGTIVRICAADAELVEGGQVLFYIQEV